MDKKNLTIGVVLLVAALATMFYGSKQSASHPPASAPATSTPTATTTATSTPAQTTTAAAPAATIPAAAGTNPPTITALAKDAEGAKVDLLANNDIEVRLTDHGGAIRSVALRQFPEALGSDHHVVFNQPRIDPMLAFVDLPGLGHDTTFQVVSHTAREVVYRAVYENRIEVTRRYILPNPSKPGTDPYQLRHETTFRNLTDQSVALPRFALSLGTASPLDTSIYGQIVTSGYSDGKKQNFIKQSDLQGGGFLSLIGMGSREPKTSITTNSAVAWASLSNQFFTSILTPDQPGVALITRRVALPSFPDAPKKEIIGLSTETVFDVPTLAPGATRTIGMSFYVGPKEYQRLANSDVFKLDQDKVMDFGFFKFFSQILLVLMTWVHGWMQDISPRWAWGWAVIITTLILKIVFMPLTLSASRSAKRMAKIQPEMKELREKLKDNPQKMQAAQMELFKKHKVNPLGGCIPIFVTLPFFFGLFRMLPSAAELRFEPFLWAHDLAAPDTVAHLFGFPVNILPLLMGISMIFQMQLTPQPTVDNAQAKIMKFMPMVFILFCYNFSCALSLYYTVNNVFSIGQQLIINRQKDHDEPAAAVAKGGKPTKNVTPRKKR